MLKSELTLETDENLMVLYQDGLMDAFETLFNRHSQRVSGFLSKRLNSKKDAQDLVQEIFFKLHRSRHQYNVTLPFSPWLFSITRSTFLDYLKKRKIEEVYDPEAAENFASSIEQESTGSNYEDVLTKVLTSQQQQVVGMRIFDDATFDEIAKKLSTSPENARQLFSRSLKTLRQAWKKGGGQ